MKRINTATAVNGMFVDGNRALGQKIGGWADPKLPQLVSNFVQRLALREKFKFC